MDSLLICKDVLNEQRVYQVCVINIQYYIGILTGHMYVFHVNYEQQWAKNGTLWHTSTYGQYWSVYHQNPHNISYHANNPGTFLKES